jgi:hypothetical protein
MKKLAIALAATTALTLAAGAGAASAQTWTQTWMPIVERQSNLDARIDAGLRSGDLTRREANRLRADLVTLARLEARYRVNGLSSWEMQDLDRRYDLVSRRVRMERADSQTGWFGGRGWNDNRGQWVNIEQRKMQLDRRIDQGLRSGQLTNSEAVRLRADFDAIAAAEARYRRNGLDMRERADLDRRVDVLAAKIRFERTDRDRTYGYNR